MGRGGWLDVTLVCGAKREWAGSFLSFGFEAGGLRGDTRPEVPGRRNRTCEVGDPGCSPCLEVLGVGRKVPRHRRARKREGLGEGWVCRGPQLTL